MIAIAKQTKGAFSLSWQLFIAMKMLVVGIIYVGFYYLLGQSDI